LSIKDARQLEDDLNEVPGVVTNGIFSHQGADIILMATPKGVVSFE
ncbi:MAG TPA: ribose 5-phosphate isomerase A, partial [Mariprofundaceae bacterium]|nr:ribose 5-phosphate isomerase A [Mariprofundaceae bacterium]